MLETGFWMVEKAGKMSDNSKYMKAFIAEAQENLQDMNSALLELEKDPGRREFIDEIFRHAHTIKSGAASMEYEEISTLAHEMESLMDRLRSQNIKPDSSVIDILFQTFDLLETLVSGVAKQEKREIEITPLIDKVKTISLAGPPFKPETAEEGQVPVEPEKGTPEKKKFNIEIKVKLKDDCVFKSIRAFMVLKSLGKIGEIVNTTPEVRDIEDEKFDQLFTVFFATTENEKNIRKAVEAVSEIDSVDILTVGRLAIKAPSLTTTAQSVRVDIERLDKLMNLVGELVIDKIKLIRIGSIHEIPELIETITHLDRLITDVQDEVMQARLVPVDMIFNRFPRMVRDLARVENKKVDFIVEGTEIEVDRTILDKISDPLIHLLRNSVDHGIESAAERKSAGKPETGSIKLTANRKKEHVIIEISDDGMGIDADRILDMAIKKGIITLEESIKLNDKEKLMLICAPGLSTCKKATDVSGRGVGMDVVKTTIESIDGMLVIDSEKGAGTKTVLKLPLTMAIARGLLVMVGEEIFIVPLADVQEIVSVRAADVKTIKGEEAIFLREEVVPLIQLDRTMGLDLKEESKSEFNALIVEVGGKPAGLVVDSLLGQQEIVIKSLDSYLKGVKGYAGATILGDGKVAFILDVPSFV
ncbi:MAG: two-component system, chemotaxis family, sensor kinase CheA [Desulfobacteraceae bacterium Eth-SRB1]|nr:MAG: two-component system, chemotaxis family, sensor kinase CheA [Desulfobacteraceae bacterium Eth-SRB1]